MRLFVGKTFEDIVSGLTVALSNAPVVHVGEWQAIQAEIPQAVTIELEDVSFETAIPDGQMAWDALVRPNQPWAEEHFLERVSSIPHNPPPSHVRWPFAQKGNEEHTAAGKFSHTYPERFWPMFAGDDFQPGREAMRGIRYPYGDLRDVVKLLQNRPGTRQAYLPVWFPEDTGAVRNQRVPCTLGYHFLLRNGRLKVVYYIRSCDFYRHFRDDVYMAGRLCQWVAEQIHVVPGNLVMHISSLHIFEAEAQLIQDEANRITNRVTAW